MEVADKQLKSNKKFLDEQAAERDAERDEFSRELEKLRITLKEKDKDNKDKSLLEKYEKKVHFFSFLITTSLWTEIAFCVRNSLL